MNIPVGDNTSRPVSIINGTYRDYVTEEGLYKIDQYQDGVWINIITTEFDDGC